MTQPEPRTVDAELGGLLPAIMAYPVIVGGFNLNRHLALIDNVRIQDVIAHRIQDIAGAGGRTITISLAIHSGTVTVATIERQYRIMRDKHR